MYTERVIGIAIIGALAGCIEDPAGAPDHGAAAQAATTSSSFVQQVNSAAATYHAVVARAFDGNAAVAGVALVAGTTRTTGAAHHQSIATAISGQSVIALIAQPVRLPSGAVHAAGLYQLVVSASGAGTATHIDPPADGISVPLPPPSLPVNTPLGNYLCENTLDTQVPLTLHDFCTRMVSCWAYDLTCPPNDSVP